MKHFDLRSRITPLNLRHIAWLLLVLVMLAYVLVMSRQTILRYDSFKATGFDLGNYDQAIWNTIHGRLFMVTNRGQDWYGPPTRLGMHFEPILLPISLLYLFFADPRTLLVFQTLALASGALPVFLLTRKYVPALPLIASVMASAYLLLPSLIGLNIFDFHPVTLAAPLLLYAVLALTYKRYGWFLIACILAASTKEDVPFAIAFFGILVLWKYKQPRLGIALFLGGMLWGLIAFKVIIPHFYPGGNNYLYRYMALGSTPQEAVVNVLQHPWLLFTTYVTLDRIYYLASLFRSAGFLALLAPEWLIGAIPSLGVNLLSTDNKLYSGVFHYNATIIPFVMLSSIHGLARAIALWHYWRGEPVDTIALTSTDPISTRSTMTATGTSRPSFVVPMFAQFSAMRVALAQSKVTHAVVVRPVTHLRTQQWPRFSERMAALARLVPLSQLQWVIIVWILSLMMVNFIIMTPLFNIFWANHEPGSREQHIAQLLAQIPPDAPVSAGENLNPHVSERQYVTVFPELTIATTDKNTTVTAQYIIVDLDNVFPEDKVTTTTLLNQLRNSGQYRIQAQAEGVILLVRNTP